jgi:hypothetical protein
MPEPRLVRAQVRAGQLATAEGVSYLEAKHMLLLSYCTNIVFYLLLKAEGRPVRTHPVIGRLLQIRAYLVRSAPILLPARGVVKLVGWLYHLLSIRLGVLHCRRRSLAEPLSDAMNAQWVLLVSVPSDSDSLLTPGWQGDGSRWGIALCNALARGLVRSGSEAASSAWLLCY